MFKWLQYNFWYYRRTVYEEEKIEYYMYMQANLNYYYQTEGS